jgi:hypothetical protein
VAHAIRRLLPALLLACAGLVLLPPAAQACSCQVPGVGKAARQADVVFTGAVLGEQRDRQRVEAGFDVDRVYQGQVDDDTVEVASPTDSCGLKLADGQSYVVFADESRTGLVSEKCSGTTRASGRTMKAVERVLGPGEKVQVPTPEPAAPTYTKVAQGSPPDFTRAAAPGAAMALVGLLGWFLVRRRS